MRGNLIIIFLEDTYRYIRLTFGVCPFLFVIIVGYVCMYVFDEPCRFPRTTDNVTDGAMTISDGQKPCNGGDRFYIAALAIALALAAREERRSSREWVFFVFF